VGGQVRSRPVRIGARGRRERSATIPTFSGLFPGTGEFFAAKRPATRVVRLGAARVHLHQVESAPPYRLRLPKPPKALIQKPAAGVALNGAHLCTTLTISS
jgi:hypothetical protein